MRPAIDGMLDQDVRVWRASESRGRFGELVRALALVATVRAAVNRSVAPLADTGPGLAPVGRIRLYTRPDSGLRERDVVELATGSTWEVGEPVNVLKRLAVHHVQVDCVAWSGTLPEDAS